MFRLENSKKFRLSMSSIYRILKCCWKWRNKYLENKLKLFWKIVNETEWNANTYRSANFTVQSENFLKYDYDSGQEHKNKGYIKLETWVSLKSLRKYFQVILYNESIWRTESYRLIPRNIIKKQASYRTKP